MDKWLSHPTALKIISVLLGLILFAMVHVDPETNSQTATTSVDTKVIEAATIIPTGLDQSRYVMTAMEPTVTRLVVEGSISKLFAASIDDYVVNVDLTNATPGTQELPLTVKLPRGIKEVALSPRAVTVQIEEIVTKSFDVQVVTQGEPAQGYIMGTPEIKMDDGAAVEVTLPKDDMERVGVVAVTLDVTGADKLVSNKKAKVVVYDTEGVEITGAFVTPSTVHAEVPVTLPYKQVPLQIRYSGTLDANLSLVSVTPATDTITVFAEQDKLDAIQLYDGVVLDLAKVKESGKIKVKAGPIDGIQSVSPGEVELDVVVEKKTTRTIDNLKISIVGTPAKMTAALRTPEGGKMSLQLSGAEGVLAAVKESDIVITANIEGLDPGLHTVTLELDLPPYVEAVLSSDQPLTATVEIIEELAPPVSGGGEDLEVGGTPTDPPDNTEGESGNSGNGNSTADNEATNAGTAPSTEPRRLVFNGNGEWGSQFVTA
ncbi:CdaR family protein [Paenibacillus sp. strain BS8-2]